MPLYPSKKEGVFEVHQKRLAGGFGATGSRTKLALGDSIDIVLSKNPRMARDPVAPLI